jgi:dephospho-CoA kinase
VRTPKPAQFNGFTFGSMFMLDEPFGLHWQGISSFEKSCFNVMPSNLIPRPYCPPNTYRIGLTGGIASGKTTMARMLAQHHALPVLDADDVVHNLYHTDTELCQQLITTFGPSIAPLPGHTGINRQALAALVFAETPQAEANRQQLGQWVYPKVRQAIATFMAQPAPIAVVVIPLLYEHNLAHWFDAVWLCAVPAHVQHQRLVAQRGLTPQQADARLAHQWTLAQKLAQHPHAVLDCSTPLADTQTHVAQLLTSAYQALAQP